MKLRNLAIRALLCLLVVGLTQAQTTPPPGTQAVLNWTEGATSIAYGFNLYRTSTTATACPAFSKTAYTLLVPGIGKATPTWTDKTLVAGTTYCYAVTAYDTSGQGGESGPSNLLLLPDPTQGGSTIGTPPSPAGLTGKRT